VTTRTPIKHLAALDDGPVKVSGWVETVRDQKKVQFVVLRDESGALQLVHPRISAPEGDPSTGSGTGVGDDVATTISGLTLGSFITVTGELKHDDRVKLGGIEVKIETLDVVAASNPETPIAEDSGIDKRIGAFSTSAGQRPI
jgi:aspartyl/asparaginyl-tRNA synthetase